MAIIKTTQVFTNTYFVPNVEIQDFFHKLLTKQRSTKDYLIGSIALDEQLIDVRTDINSLGAGESTPVGGGDPNSV